MKYVIEFDLPDNDTVLHNIKTAWVGWNVWGYSGNAHAKPKQPERKKGRWIEYIPEHGKCPFCGNQVDYMNGKENNFCGECSADMRGEQDE